MEETKDSNLKESLLPEHVHMCHYKHNKNLHRVFYCNKYFSLWQLALFWALLFSFCFQGLIAYNLYLFEIEPEYLCKYTGSEQFVPCQTSDLERAETWKYDTTGNNLNLDNWFTRLHFENIEKWKIGMIGSIYFFGFIGGSFLTRFADIYGRKPFVVIGGFVQSLCGFLLIVSNNLILIYANIFIIGIASPLLSSIGYNYMMELVPKNKQNLVNTILMCFDSFGSLFGLAYFMFILQSIILKYQNKEVNLYFYSNF